MSSEAGVVRPECGICKKGGVVEGALSICICRHIWGLGRQTETVKHTHSPLRAAAYILPARRQAPLNLSRDPNLYTQAIHWLCDGEPTTGTMTLCLLVYSDIEEGDMTIVWGVRIPVR